MAAKLSAQTQRSIEFSADYDKLMILAERYSLEAAVLNILVGRIAAKKLSLEDFHDVNGELKSLLNELERLNGLGAQKAIDPFEVNSMQEQNQRLKSISEFESLQRQLQTEARKYNNRAGLKAAETAAQRDARWLKEVPHLMTTLKCSQREAITKIFKNDLRLGITPPKDPYRAYQRAKKRPKV